MRQSGTRRGEGEERKGVWGGVENRELEDEGYGRGGEVRVTAQHAVQPMHLLQLWLPWAKGHVPFPAEHKWAGSPTTPRPTSARLHAWKPRIVLLPSSGMEVITECSATFGKER